MPQSSLRSRKGFTLIELLVVIAIIAILAAILFPVFQKVRENARKASDASNQKQIGLALTQYSQDYDELLVAAWYGNNGYLSSSNVPGAIRYKWMDAIFPYVKSTGVFHDPDDSGYPINGVIGPTVRGNSTGNYIPYYMYDQPGQPQSPNEAYYGSYGINSYNYGGKSPDIGPGNNYNQAGYTLNSLQSPATTIWIADGGGAYQFSSNDNTLWRKDTFPVGGGLTSLHSGTQDQGPIDGNPIMFRHNELANVLFCDGHVKALRIGDVLKQSVSPADNKNYQYLLTMRGQ